MPDIERPITRREILKKGAIGAVGLTVLPSVLAACSSSATPVPTQAPTPVPPGTTPGPTIVPVPTTPNYAGRTLTIWDYESASPGPLRSTPSSPRTLASQ